jgi:hypothetical protein
MALVAASKQLFLYGYQVTELNSSLDFKASPLDSPPRQATLRLGFYSLTSLLAEVKRALTEQDPAHEYTVTADRTMNGGTENRVTIETDHTFLQILFNSGPRASSSCAALLGFTATDQTGATSYTGTSTTGTALIPERAGYNYVPAEFNQQVQGSVNISTSGLKESIVYNLQEFWAVEFKFEPKSKVLAQWVPFMKWAIQQRRLEFTPNISTPSIIYEGTLEKTDADGKGLAFKMSEMLPEFPDTYRTGSLLFRRSTI